MKSYEELKTDVEQLGQQMAEVRKRERAESLKNVK